MLQQFEESILFGVGMTLATFFWVWFFRRLYLNGWRPLIFVLIAAGWKRVKFYLAWLRFLRRNDQLHSTKAPSDVALPAALMTNLLDASFSIARQRQNETYQRWVSISWAMGGQLPNSLLSVNVQRDGELDQILRCLEDEFLLPETGKSMFKAHYSLMLANLWIGGIYETIRLLQEIAGKQKEYDPIAHDLRLLRVALEKHQIADDRRLTEPLKMARHPPNDNETDVYIYSPDDPQRSHIMPSGFSARGSVMWQVIDLKANTQRWIERRDLSDRILDRWSNPKDKRP